MVVFLSFCQATHAASEALTMKILQRMRPDYKDHYRATAVGYILSFAARLSIVDDYAHDAVLLMDRAMSTCMQVPAAAPSYMS